MSELSANERDALKAASEALVHIRLLASRPVNESTRVSIHRLVDAFHNIPDYCAGSADQRRANEFLLESEVNIARKAFAEHGVRSRYLAPMGMPEIVSAPINNTSDNETLKKFGNLPARLFARIFTRVDK